MRLKLKQFLHQRKAEILKQWESEWKGAGESPEGKEALLPLPELEAFYEGIIHFMALTEEDEGRRPSRKTLLRHPFHCGEKRQACVEINRTGQSAFGKVLEKRNGEKGMFSENEKLLCKLHFNNALARLVSWEIFPFCSKDFKTSCPFKRP